jgi:F0F1-type ATP synthase membrane subunit b/b'
MFLVQLIVLQIIIFAALIFVLRSILTTNISKATTHLDDLNSDFIRKEEEVKKLLDEARKYYDDTIAKAKAEIDKLRIDADHQNQAERDKILAAAQVESEEVIAKAHKTLSAMIVDVKKELELEMAGRMTAMMNHVLPENVKRELHRSWVDDLLGGDMSAFSAVQLPEGAREVKLVGAYPLTPEQIKDFAKKLKQVFGRDFLIKDESDPALLAGVLLSVGDLVLDGTATSKLQQIIQNESS